MDYDMHIIKESEVGEVITYSISVKADWDPAEQRMLFKTERLWYKLLRKDKILWDTNIGL